MAMVKPAVVVVMATLIYGFAFAVLASAIPGTATYYTTYTPSACYGFEDKGVMIAAASSALWNNGAACGKRYSIRCTGRTNEGVLQPCRDGSVTVTIVDFCPAGCQATIDLSQEAFSAIADTNAGKIQIDYTEV